VPSPIDLRLAPLYDGEASRYTVLALRYGTCFGTRGRYLRGVEPGGEADAPLRMDFFLWTIGSGDGAIVVDTGFAPDVAERRQRTCLAAPRSLLARAGVEPATVETVVLTHLHYDHTGNVDAFPRASFHVHRRELEFWRSAEARRPEFAAVAEPRELAAIDAAVDAGRVREIENDRLIAPGVLALWTGGHAPGQLIVVVRSGDSIVVLASDALHFYEELDGGASFAIFSDLEEMNEGYELLRELGRRGAVVVPGHDPLVLDRFPRLDGELSELGVRVA
jgi:glyoxylase-like metal-dependent hydrolase (beta-lactamase superfamily II)